MVVEQANLRRAREGRRGGSQRQLPDGPVELLDPLPVAEILEEGAWGPEILGANREVAGIGEIALDPGGEQLDLAGRDDAAQDRRPFAAEALDRFGGDRRGGLGHGGYGTSRPSHPR